MTYDSLVADIKSLPPLSDAAFVIQRLYVKGDRNIDIIKLTRTIESDSLLTVNILRMINSPIYGFSKKITSILQAVTLFGTQIIYGLVMNYAINEKLKANMMIYNVSNSQFNRICHLQSSLMMQWYSKINLKQAQFLASLALIMEAGKLVLAREIRKSSYEKEFKKGFLIAEIIEEYEHDTVGTTSYNLSGLLFEHWNLDPLYVKLLKGLDYDLEYESKFEHYISALNVVRTVVNVKNILSDESIEQACGIVEKMRLDPEVFEHVAYGVRERYYKNR